ncbi:MAG: tetratricopeptide repeat protein [Flavobacteriales bacterium]
MKKILYLFIILSVASCTTPPSETKTEVVKTYASELDSLNALIEEEKDIENALLNRAKYYDVNGKTDLALKDLNQKMTYSITDEDYYLKGNILYSITDFTSANKAYRLCVEENPENAKCYVKLAQIQQLLDNHDECLGLLDSALYADRQLPDAYFLKGLTFELRRARGDTALAISSYQTATELNPKFYDAFMRLGDLHAGKGDSLAIEYYKSAISLQPNRIEGHYNLGIYLQNSERFDRAMKRYDEILAIDDQSFPAYFNQGYLLLVHADMYPEAVEKFTKALEHNPDYIEAYHNRGLSYKNMGKYELARADFSKVLELNPDLTQTAIELSELDKIR